MAAKGQMTKLSLRERQVLQLIARGHTQKDTAQQLQIGVKAIETFKTRGMKKLGLATRHQLVSYAVTQGWLSI
jgi:DNA-binding CsgD family transcriptional regulator